MATEPERPIEKLLRDYAKKRREQGAPFELHPANRRLLQAEVARLARKSREERGSILYFLARMRWALGAVALLLLIAAIVVPSLSGHRPAAEMAKNEPLSASAPVKESPAEPAGPPPASAAPSDQGSQRLLALNSESPAPARREPKGVVGGMAGNRNAGEVRPGMPMEKEKADRLTEGSLAALKQNEESISSTSGGVLTFHAPPQNQASAALNESLAPTTNASAELPPPVAAPAPQETLAQILRRAATSPPPPLAQSSAEPPPGAQNFYRLQASAAATTNALTDMIVASAQTQKTSKDLQFADHFSQLDRQKLEDGKLGEPAAVPSSPVLLSFSFERAGDQVRIVDSDGSVYTGYAQPVVAPNRQGATSLSGAAGFEGAPQPSQDKTAVAGLTTLSSSSQSFSFSVSGTNRTVNQEVVFAGSFIPGIPGTNAPVGARAKAPADASRFAPLQPNAAVPMNSHISGTLTLGQGNPINLDAVRQP